MPPEPLTLYYIDDPKMSFPATTDGIPVSGIYNAAGAADAILYR